MKRFLISVALACVFSSSALAGDIPSGGIPSPAPSGGPSTTSTSLGEVPTVGLAEQLSSDALSAILSVLGFLTA